MGGYIGGRSVEKVAGLLLAGRPGAKSLIRQGSDR